MASLFGGISSGDEILNDAGFYESLQTEMVNVEMLQAELSKRVSTSQLPIATFVETFPLSQPHPFQRVFEKEIGRVARFIDSQQDALEGQSKTLLRSADDSSTRRQYTVGRDGKMVIDTRVSTQKLADRCVALQRFLTQNRQILSDMASKADEEFGTTCVACVRDLLPKPTINSGLVCIHSDIYNAIRKAEEKDAVGEALWQAPSSFQRSTTKYWVKDENLTQLMLACAAEAPLLIYGKTGPLTSNWPMQKEGDKLWESLASKITSVYFDSADMCLYTERIQRLEGAQLLRARWYGTRKPVGTDIVFVELKTHHEKWVANKSVKERASIQEQDMVKFLEPVVWTWSVAEEMIKRAKPKLDAKELHKATELLIRMHNLVVKHRLTACVRSVYDRAAFQSSKSNDLRLTLDREVTLVDERPQCPSHRSWCLMDDEISSTRSMVVPFNVFEVKLASEDGMPPGLVQCENESVIELAAKFSKFTTGGAAFNHVPILPYWAAHPAFHTFFQMNNRSAARNNANETFDDEQCGLESFYNLMGDMNVFQSDEVRIAPKNPARIEPKTYFANERTYIQWLSASLLLLSVASLMLQLGEFNMTSAVISLSAFVLASYSSFIYFQRLHFLKNREPMGYFDRVGPILLALMAGVAVFLILADSIKGSEFLDFFSDTEWGGRRLFHPVMPFAIEEIDSHCSKELTRRSFLVGEAPSGIAVNTAGDKFLVTSNQNVYALSMLQDQDEVTPLCVLKVPHAQLDGLVTIDDRLFVASGGPKRTELMEMSWEEGNQKLRIEARWLLEDSTSKIDGFGIVPSTGSLYIHMNSTIHLYSLPTKESAPRPVRLKSLNMKVLSRGADNAISAIGTFEGVTYLLKKQQNVLEAWDLSLGSRLGEIKLPPSPLPSKSWDGFVFERKPVIGSIQETDKETPLEVSTTGFRGASGNEASSHSTLFLHMSVLMGSSGDSNEIWSFQLVEGQGNSVESLAIPDCAMRPSSVN